MKSEMVSNGAQVSASLSVSEQKVSTWQQVIAGASLPDPSVFQTSLLAFENEHSPGGSFPQGPVAGLWASGEVPVGLGTGLWTSDRNL